MTGLSGCAVAEAAEEGVSVQLRLLDDPEESIDVVAREFHVPTLEYLAPMLVSARLDRARPLASCNPGSSALLLGRLAAGHGRGQRERHASAPVGDSG